jgi:hypothetical protein
MSDNIDIFDTNDILDEFDVIKDNSHCYAYLTIDIYKSICRFCFDMKISLPKNIEYFKGVLCGGEKYVDTTIILDDSSFIFNFYSDENKIIYNTFEFGLEMRYYFFDRNFVE